MLKPPTVISVMVNEVAGELAFATSLCTGPEALTSASPAATATDVLLP
jgi:hypothetical protein